MIPIRLTFFCELEPKPLLDLINEEIIADLKKLSASISLGILDLSNERAQVVQQMNEAGIPVIAWLLLPEEDGYWFNVSNSAQAYERYLEFKRWSNEHNLYFSRVGLDIEPDIREMVKLSSNKLELLPTIIRRLVNRRQILSARSAYRQLTELIHEDGFPVDSYQFPIIADERKAGSTLLQRMGGLVDIPVDREVWMLYTSLLRPYGIGFLTSYAPEAQAIGIGITGGGVEIGTANRRPLTWEEFARDLRLAWRWCDDLHIFSLEGCVQQCFIERLKTFAWDYPIILPSSNRARVDQWRRALRSGLWLSAHFAILVMLALSSVLLFKILRNYLAGGKRK